MRDTAVDPDLLTLVQHDANTLKTPVEQLIFEVQGDREQVSQTLQTLKDVSTTLEEAKEEEEAKLASVEHAQDAMTKKLDATETDLEARIVSVERAQNAMSERLDTLETDMEIRLAIMGPKQDTKQEQSSLLKTSGALIAQPEDQLNSVILFVMSRQVLKK